MVTSSRKWANRMRRLGLLLITLGALVLVAVAGRAYLQAEQARQARQEYLAKLFLPRAGEPVFEPPFLTGSRQDQVYTAGQTALAFASGFQPDEPVFARLYHGMHGLLAAELLQADALGQVVLVHPLSERTRREDFTPTGALWFQAESLSGIKQEFAFRLEPGAAADQMPPTKGVYPAIAVPGSTVMLWCSGQKVGQAPGVDFMVDGRSIPTRDLDLTVYPITGDGLLLAKLTLSNSDPTGDWTAYLGTCSLQFSVRNLISTKAQQ